MKLRSLLAIGLAAALFTNLAGAAEERTLRIGTESAYPPFEYRDNSGAMRGFDIEVGDAICAKMAVKCVWVPQGFDGLIMSLQASKIDLIISSMSVTEERAKAVDFSRPYYVTAAQLVAPKDSKITEDPATWKGKTIGVQSGTIHQTFAEQRLGGITDKAYDTLEDAYLDLQSGRVDAVFADKVVLYDWLQKEGLKGGFDYAGKPVEDPAVTGNVAIALRKGDSGLKDKLNAAIDTVLSDGEFDRISAQYFPFSIRPK